MRFVLKLPHALPSDVPPPEDTDFDFNELSLLKERIEQWRKDNEDG